MRLCIKYARKKGNKYDTKVLHLELSVNETGEAFEMKGSSKEKIVFGKVNLNMI